MDKTKEYILKCEKAVEVQELWLPKFGDIYYRQQFEKVVLISEFGYYCPNKKQLSKSVKPDIWLPRQDQIQSMFGKNYPDSASLLNLFNYFVQKLKGPVDSMEQLWLEFLYNRMYDKKWNGKDWVK